MNSIIKCIENDNISNFIAMTNLCGYMQELCDRFNNALYDSTIYQFYDICDDDINSYQCEVKKTECASVKCMYILANCKLICEYANQTIDKSKLSDEKKISLKLQMLLSPLD